MRFEPASLRSGGRPAVVRIVPRIRLVVVLPFVPLITIDPEGSCEARPRTIDGSTRSATRPGRAVPPPRLNARETRPDSRAALTAAMRRTPPGTVPGSAAGTGQRAIEQFVEHPIECTDSDRKVALALLEVSSRAGNPIREPHAVSERDHEVLATLPDKRRNGDLGEFEPPGHGKCEVVVDPAVRRDANCLVKIGGHVVGELPGKNRSVRRREKTLECLDDLCAGGFAKVRTHLFDDRSKRCLTFEGLAEFHDIAFPHAGHE